MTVAATLIVIAPELEAIDSDRRDDVIAWAELRVSGSKFGSVRELAVAYLAAHMLTVGARSGDSGAISRRREGDLEVAYGLQQNVQGLDSTSYGQEYKTLCKENIIGPMTRRI